jgi:arylsulfatase A-like enzyme
MMNRRSFLGAMGTGIGAGLLGTTGCGTRQGAKPRDTARRPNIVLMMADDMGYSDIGCYGGEIATPNLDRLAGNGLRFTQFYNAARCCPTRACLLTGLYPHQAGIGHMVNPKPFPGYAGDLNRSSVTIAEVLKAAGYRTYMSGKWHVTPVSESKHNWPRQRGFDCFYGTITGAGSFYDPVTLTRDNEPEPLEDGYYYTHAIAREASTIIEQHDGSDPFFLYVAFTAPHWPLHALEQDIAKYTGRYAAGWDALRDDRQKRMIEMGLIDEEWPLTARDPAVPAWQDAPDKEWQQRRMEVYAAQVDAMDQAIGRIVETLQTKGMLDDTLILFLADNGGCAEELRDNQNRPRPLFAPQTTPDGRSVRMGNDPAVMPGAPETYQSYGIPWANASNTPFRLYKHWVHEGGIASPLIAHWPAGITTKDELRRQPAHLIDLMATCVDLAGAEYPTSKDGNAITPMEGVSLVPAFINGELSRAQPLFWEHEGNRAIRDGTWKLVSRHNNDSQWELYDLEKDRTETDDLAGQYPQEVERLRAAWEGWANRVGVVDWDTVVQAPAQPPPPTNGV